MCFNCADLPSSQPLGEIRSLTDNFQSFRNKKRLIISQEITRLLQGFEVNVDPKSRLKAAMNDTISIMKIPEWQKSSKWLVRIIFKILIELLFKNGLFKIVL